MENLSSAHTFDYIVLRTNPGLTSCEDFATTLIFMADIIDIVSGCSLRIEVCHRNQSNKSKLVL